MSDVGERKPEDHAERVGNGVADTGGPSRHKHLSALEADPDRDEPKAQGGHGPPAGEGSPAGQCQAQIRDEVLDLVADIDVRNRVLGKQRKHRHTECPSSKSYSGQHSDFR